MTSTTPVRARRFSFATPFWVSRGLASIAEEAGRVRRSAGYPRSHRGSRQGAQGQQGQPETGQADLFGVQRNGARPPRVRTSRTSWVAWATEDNGSLAKTGNASRLRNSGRITGALAAMALAGRDGTGSPCRVR